MIENEKRLAIALRENLRARKEIVTIADGCTKTKVQSEIKNYQIEDHLKSEVVNFNLSSVYPEFLSKGRRASIVNHLYLLFF